jgi:RNA polymerase sigma-70 factor (ECF subfamily)
LLGLGATKELTDEEAMVRFQNGDVGAFDLLLYRHSTGVLRFIMKMIRITITQAEDILQEVFLKAIENRRKYDSSHKFTTWLYTIARNHCIDYLRNEKYRRYYSLDAPLSGDRSDGPVILEIVGSREKNQEERAIDKEIQRLFNSGIEGMREEFREVFLLREIEGLSLKEIAEITEVPLSTAKSRLRYAYEELREVFVKAGYFEEKQKHKGGVKSKHELREV